MDREKLEQTVRKVIGDRNARSLGERSEVYSAARASVRKAMNIDPAALADVDEIIGEIEASHATQPKVEGGRQRGSAKTILSGLAGGAILGGVATAAVMVLGLQFQPHNPTAATLMQRYNATAPLLPAAVDYLHTVADAVVQMQKDNPTALEAKLGGRFVGLPAFDPELAKKLPRGMPPGSGVIVRADKSNYKVLFNWTLCEVARSTKPEMADPVRSKGDTLGCPFFGLWTPAAEKW